jgi:SAM-dependent methyltransferase
LLAQRGLRVIAIEPSAEMAAVGRRRADATAADVRFVCAEFERWSPPRAFGALVCANAWHWIEPARRYPLAHAALAPGGTLACLWTLPDWSGCGLRERLRATYHRLVPELEPRFPMHPGSAPEALAGDWDAEIAAAGGQFADPRTRWFRWTVRFTAAGYVEVLGTHQDHILLSTARRTALMASITETIADAGGVLELPTVTRVCLASRTG